MLPVSAPPPSSSAFYERGGRAQRVREREREREREYGMSYEVSLGRTGTTESAFVWFANGSWVGCGAGVGGV